VKYDRALCKWRGLLYLCTPFVKSGISWISCLQKDEMSSKSTKFTKCMRRLEFSHFSCILWRRNSGNDVTFTKCRHSIHFVNFVILKYISWRRNELGSCISWMDDYFVSFVPTKLSHLLCFRLRPFYGWEKWEMAKLRHEWICVMLQPDGCMDVCLYGYTKMYCDETTNATNIPFGIEIPPATSKKIGNLGRQPQSWISEGKHLKRL
jgi:hypothetical protein